jgi:dTDP-4-amino-4,6-dideoxygalactose transaminase
MSAQKIITVDELRYLIYLERVAIESFETKLADYLGVEYVVGTSMRRTGLFALLRAINLQKDDEGIVPAYICEVVHARISI